MAMPFALRPVAPLPYVLPLLLAALLGVLAPGQALAQSAANGTPLPDSLMPPPPPRPASNLEAVEITSQSMVLRWKPGGGTARVIFAHTQYVPSGNLPDGRTFNASATYGLTNPFDGLGYCVYNGSQNYVQLNGLQPDTPYTFMVVEYNGHGPSTRYLNTPCLYGRFRTAPAK